MEQCICFTGGGTGGHVFPGIAVIDEFVKQFSGRIIWIGSSKGMERDIVEGRGIGFYGVPSGKLRRYISFANVIDVWKVAAGFIASIFILAREKPLLVFSKGGYVSVPVVAAAGLLGIPVFTHESDYDPGIATRINARFAEKILTSFAETRSFFKAAYASKVLHTGNPIRTGLAKGDAVNGRSFVGAPANAKVLLVLGGSQGARSINEAIESSLDTLASRCYVVHQTGAKHYRQSMRNNYFSAPFFGKELADIIAAADLVVCRAGSNTLWELASAGKPSILVPLPESGSRGDQIRNASVFERAGASRVVNDDTSLCPKLLDLICNLIDNNSALDHMRECARSISKQDAAAQIAKLVYDRVQARQKGE